MVYLKIPSRRIDRVFTEKGTQNLLVKSQGTFPSFRLPKKKKKKKCWFYLKNTSSPWYTSVFSQEKVSLKNKWHHGIPGIAVGEKRAALSFWKALHISFMKYVILNWLLSVAVKATPCSSFSLWSDQHILVTFFSTLYSAQTAPKVGAWADVLLSEKKAGERILCLLKYSHSANFWVQALLYCETDG